MDVYRGRQPSLPPKLFSEQEPCPLTFRKSRGWERSPARPLLPSGAGRLCPTRDRLPPAGAEHTCHCLAARLVTSRHPRGGGGGGAFPRGGTPRDPHPCPTPHPPVSSADATQGTYGPVIPAGASTGRKAPALRLTSGAPGAGWEPAGHLRKSHRATVSNGLDLACDSFLNRATPTRPSFTPSDFVTSSPPALPTLTSGPPAASEQSHPPSAQPQSSARPCSSDPASATRPPRARGSQEESSSCQSRIYTLG